MTATRWALAAALLLGACGDADRATTDAAARADAADERPPDVALADASGCYPADGAVVGPWVAPHAAMTACTGGEVDGYYAACLDKPAALPITCQQFVAAHAACAECLAPQHPATEGAGVVLGASGEFAFNVAGCIALSLGDVRPEGCGAREQAAFDCEAAVCARCDDADACAARARTTSCAGDEVRRCPELAGAAPCGLDGTARERFQRIARVFCGGG